jgi:hypothetical protein
MAGVVEYVDIPAEEAAKILKRMIEEAEPPSAVFKFSTRTYMLVEYNSSKRSWSIVVSKVFGPHTRTREVARLPLSVPETITGLGHCHVSRGSIIFMVGEAGFEIRVDVPKARVVTFTKLR